MLTKKTLVIGLALVFLVMPGLVLAGEGEGGHAPHIEIDVTRLGEPCTYWAPDQYGGSLQLHFGLQPSITINGPDVVEVIRACTDQLVPGQELCTISHMPLDCFLRGEHYIALRALNPEAGCILFTVKGLRGAAASVMVAGSKRALQYLSTDEVPGQVDQICGLIPNQPFMMRLMMCPDLNRDHVITLFHDIFGTAFLMGTDEDHPDWNPLGDHNQDGGVAMFTDLFAVMYRHGLECDDFGY